MTRAIYFAITVARDGEIRAATTLPGNQPHPHTPAEALAHAVAYALSKRVPLDFSADAVPAIRLARELVSPDQYGYAIPPDVWRNAKAVADAAHYPKEPAHA